MEVLGEENDVVPMKRALGQAAKSNYTGDIFSSLWGK
jgi:hypothetical protein